MHSHAAPANAEESAVYAPLNVLKPVGRDIWIVDSGPLHLMGMALPIRMTVIRLPSGQIWLHSPTDFTAALRADIDRLGPVAHIVAPNTFHWLRVRAWHEGYPQAETWGVPHLAARRQVRRSGTIFTRELGAGPEAEWAGELDQTLVPGGFGYREAVFFHHPSHTLILTDLVVNMEPARLTALGRLGARLTGTLAPDGKAPIYMRQIVKMKRREARAAISRMIAHEPVRAVFSHGAWYEEGATERLRRSLAWLIR